MISEKERNGILFIGESLYFVSKILTYGEKNLKANNMQKVWDHLNNFSNSERSEQFVKQNTTLEQSKYELEQMIGMQKSTETSQQNLFL